MITLLSTSCHSYTHQPLQKTDRLDFRVLTYNRAFRAERLPRGTYIFSDLDRLSYWELELAARLYRTLQAAGLRVLNDPARLRQRFPLLRALQHAGFNRFGAWTADDPSRPARYPVFLRTQCAHRGPLSDLLADEDEIAVAIEAALANGVPMRELLLVEYCAQPVSENLFRKLATFRVGERMVSTLCVHEGHWAAKYGQLGIATQELYDDEFAIVDTNRYGEPLRPAFDIGHADYGRADFALVDGRPQVYEINTNPMLDPVGQHPFAIRIRADALFFDRLIDAFCEIDSEGAGPVAIDDAALATQRKRDRFVLRSRWTP